MKAEILALLRGKNNYISGQELCEHFGVSRTAVWKAINSLKKEGYEIEAVQNKGYKLVENHDVFSQNELESRMDTKWVGRTLHFFDTIGSTNIEAKYEAEKGAPSGTLIVRACETAGRGRRGRHWDSPANTNIYLALMLKPAFMPDKASMLTIVMALAVAKGMKEVLGENAADVGIKWPNDIVINGKKLCGILTEMNVERDYIQYVVIGVGINVFKQDYSSEIADTATDIETACGQRISRSILVASIMKAFEECYEKFLETLDLSGLKEEYTHLLVNKDRQVHVLDPKGEYTGVALGINDTGELLVKTSEDEIKEVYAGEVSVRGIYGYV